MIAADTLDHLARAIAVPADALRDEIDALSGEDRFGRRHDPAKALRPPYRAIKVTGALFHTQGGLAVDANARVLRQGGRAFPNLFAAGGAAAGVSGNTAAGYLSGNGLLTATVLGRIAGDAAGRMAG